MFKKMLLYSLVIMLTLAVSIAGFSYFLPSESYEVRQVKKIAPTTDNQLLHINKHISLHTRPDETFTFPVKLGQFGPVNSLYSGKTQYLFYCMTVDSGLGQPLVDNQAGYGVPVYEDITEPSTIIGYSKDCNIAASLQYYLISQQGVTTKLSLAALRDLDRKNIDGALLRVEQGTINRFIYTLVMPISIDEIGQRLGKSHWNKRLIYQFNGGSGIGFRQGKQKAKRVIDRQKQQLLDGYAVISSSGNKTSYTYNMLLAEDTARRVKRHFISLYGEPLYTVGIGGSGGGLAQYLIAQNSVGILDGLIPLYSYPDMISQTTYALDCDLLNNYFTFRAKKKSQWLDWQKRQSVEGMNALNNFPQRAGYLQPVNQIMAGFVPSLPKGNSECINGYFGLSSFINNPRQGFLRNFFHDDDVVEQVQWSYWQDLVNLLGTDEHGFGLSTWDNVGVQYGLVALQNQMITINQFIDLNSKIGSWKPQRNMKAEHIWLPFGRKLPFWLSLWGNQNIAEVKEGVADRHTGSIKAMQAAYRTGQVFIGKISVPVIDVRHYLEDDLDMHHVSASFYSRLRMLEYNNHSDNHVIWISDKQYNPATLAFKKMDDWLLTLKGYANLTVQTAKPEHLVDSCFSATGKVLYQGEDIWDGQWNNKSEGGCQEIYPMYSTSRIQAGGTWSGDIFKCQTISVGHAIKQGMYGAIDVQEHQQKLEKIFPQGVCDYTKKDQGRPKEL